MTKSEREELAKVARLNAKVAKADIDQRQRELLADAEARLAATFDEYDAAWRDARAMADEAIRVVNQRIAEACEARGVPKPFRPTAYVGWFTRGENAAAGRRAELRKVAQTRLEADARRAKVDVDRRTAEICTQLAAGGLTSPEAQAFLASMPRVDELLPALHLPELDGAAAPQPDPAVIEGGSA